MNSVMSSLYETLLSQVSMTPNSTTFGSPNTPFLSSLDMSNVFPSSLPTPNTSFLSSINIKSILYMMWSFVTISRILFAILVFTNLKNVPFIWTLRIINAFRFCTKTMRPKVPPTSAQLFQPMITSSRPPMSEIDIYMHKSNSTYFTDLDIARVHLVCTLFSSGIEHIRGGTSAINRGGGSKPFFGLALGAVSCNFKRELKPYEPYEMWTRVLSWDEKWIYILTHFVKKGAVKPKSFTLYPEQNSKHAGKKGLREDSVKAMEANPAVVATALSKCVFKAGRKTISPMLMFKYSGLLPADTIIDEATATLPETYSFRNSSLSSSEASTRRSSLISEVDPTSRRASDTDSGVGGMDSSDEEHTRYEKSPELTELERIEKERRRGMRAAMFLSTNGQAALEMEFSGAEEKALGKHTDGSGIVGVVSTLAVLAGLRRNKIL